MELSIVDGRGFPLTLAQVKEHVTQFGDVPDISIPGPEPVIQRLEQLAHKAWRSEVSCPPELFWVEDRTEFVKRYIALHI